MIFWTIISCLLIGADQLVKYWVVQGISPEDCFRIIPGVLDFVYVKNTGAAFSIFSGRTGILGILSIAFCIAVIVYTVVKKPGHPLMRGALSLLFAGAVGNAMDRIARGYVIDFIQVTFVDFPVFNIADICITVGAVLLAVYLIFFDKES